MAGASQGEQSFMVRLLTFSVISLMDYCAYIKVQAVMTILDIVNYNYSEMEMSLRLRSFTPKKEKLQASDSKKRSQTNNKKNFSLAAGTEDRSFISNPPAKNKKEKVIYQIVNTARKNNEVQYLGENNGKKKTFTRKALLESHEQFEEVLKFYRDEVVKMVKYLHFDNLHKCEQNA